MIEVDQDKRRGICNNYRRTAYSTVYTCVAKRNPDHPSIKVCNNCPVWTTTDATYEDLFNTEIEQTYDWWRSEFIRTGHSYAKDRMMELYSATPTVAKPVPDTAAKVLTKKPQQLSIPDSVKVMVCFMILIFVIIMVVSR